jgi:hypothetical protein
MGNWQLVISAGDCRLEIASCQLPIAVLLFGRANDWIRFAMGNR